MAEKQNLSDIAVTTPKDKRKPSIATLTKLIKSQCTHQRRSVATKSRSSGGGMKVFLVKALIAGGAVYLTSWLGVWGEPEQSKKLMTTIKRVIHKIDNDVTRGVFPERIRTDIGDGIEKSKQFIQYQLENIPEELKAFYDKSEKYFTDLIKGKKP